MAASSGIGLALSLINLAIPEIGSVMNMVTIMKHKNGTNTVTFYLDEADPQASQNQQMIADYYASRGKNADGTKT